MSRPVIGITGPERGGLAAWLFAAYAVRRAGGRPVRITPERPCDPGALHGLIVGGGADVDPNLYGEDRVTPRMRRLRRTTHRPLRFLATLVLFPLIWWLRRLFSTRYSGGDAARDALETRLLEEALRRDLPVLGICRGAQLLNVVCGGTLHQCLADFYAEAPNIWTIWPQKRIYLEPDSHLAGITGREHCNVNSLHNQAIREPGGGLRIVARERNGVTQAIEHAGDAWLIGVQWHPEYLPQRPEQRALFRALVARADRD